MSHPMEPVFQDPPRAGDKDAAWQDTIQALIANTGRWALIADMPEFDANVGKLSGRIRRSTGGWAGHAWEVTTRTIGKQGELRRSHVYARHVGPINQDGAS